VVRDGFQPERDRGWLWSSLKYGAVRKSLEYSIGEEDIELFLGAIRKAGQISKQTYKARFIVFLWDDRGRQTASNPGLVRRLQGRLKDSGITTFRVEDDVFKSDFETYHLPLDGHPNAKANKAIAAFLKRYLLSKSL